MPDKRDLARADQLENEKNDVLQKIRFTENKVKALEAKDRLLTKSGRNKFIFSLGLRAEPYLKEPEFLTDDDLDEIFICAFGDSYICELIEARTRENKEAFFASIKPE